MVIEHGGAYALWVGNAVPQLERKGEGRNAGECEKYSSPIVVMDEMAI